jgi:hypothetical protein
MDRDEFKANLAQLQADLVKLDADLARNRAVMNLPEPPLTRSPMTLPLTQEQWDYVNSRTDWDKADAANHKEAFNADPQ